MVIRIRVMPGRRGATRWISLGGLFEFCGLGAADHQMAKGMIGDVNNAIHSQTTQDYQNHVRIWAERAERVVAGKLGYCQGTIEHFFHGQKSKRQYQGRWQILIDWKFSPSTDLKCNSFGVLEFTGDKPGFEIAVDRYYRSRDEDQNTLAAGGE